MNNSNETTSKEAPVETQQELTERDKSDINACVFEINKILDEQINPILKKYRCVQTYSVSGEGSQMQIRQLILKQK